MADEPLSLPRRDLVAWQAYLRLVIRSKLPRGRRPSDGSMPAVVEPPRGPRPLAGGTAAPLEFDA